MHPILAELPTAELAAFARRARERYDAFKGRGLKLDLTRGKPGPEQLDLAGALAELPGRGDWRAADGSDCRNYGGGARGLAELRALFAPVLGAPPGQVIAAGNSSLALMHDAVAYALLSGPLGGRGPWSRESGDVAFLCPVPGYDRHFAVTEGFGIRNIAVPLTGEGPDMDAVGRLVADPSVRGMWCVPRHSNPTGETYSADTVARLARMRTGAPDFRLFWDDAYAVHHLTEDGRPALPNILEACAAAGHPDRPFVFASTSKITWAGAGVAFFAASEANVAWYAGRMGLRTIGPDKVNQLRHVRLLRDAAGLEAHMAAHRHVLAPKFARVQEALRRVLGGTGVATWTEPRGGYFVSLALMEGTARRTVALAAEAGIALTPAGATFPGGRDPADRNLRLAPSFPTAEEAGLAAEGAALAALLAATERLLGCRGASSGVETRRDAQERRLAPTPEGPSLAWAR